MSKASQQLEARAEKIRAQLASAEARAEHLRNQLAAIEAELTGKPKPITGLDLLWKSALPIARTRSSKIQCRAEWNRIPASERPTVQSALQALKTWNRCEEWKKDGNSFVPGLHRWIKNRQWENLPEGDRRDPLSRYRTSPKPLPQTAPEDAASPEEIAAMFSTISRIKS